MHSILVVIALVVAGVYVLAYLMQERLIFFPQRLDERSALDVQRSYPRAKPFQLETRDGVQLRGWLLDGSAHTPWPLLIYFGGNAEEVSGLVAEFSRISGWAVLLVNYRGYGLSEGQPSEAVLFRDALAVYDHVIQRPDVDVQRVVALGRSLGTGVATYLASQRPIAGVVLVSPYDSLVEVARGAYPFLPVSVLLRHRFESAARASSIHAPLLVLVAAQDEIVRPERSRQLARAWGGPVRLEVLSDVDHNTVQSHSDYWKLISAFLAERRAAPSTGSAQ